GASTRPQRTLHQGAYIVTAALIVGNNAASDNTVPCKLLENFNELDRAQEALVPLATFSRSMAMTGASTGGSIKIACSGDNAATARSRVITAVKVGTLHP